MCVVCSVSASILARMRHQEDSWPLVATVMEDLRASASSFLISLHPPSKICSQRPLLAPSQILCLMVMHLVTWCLVNSRHRPNGTCPMTRAHGLFLLKFSSQAL